MRGDRPSPFTEKWRPVLSRYLQTRLRELGLYDGEIDGKEGRAGIDALVAGYRGRPAWVAPAAKMPAGWAWSQSAGRLYRDGKAAATGYSGRNAPGGQQGRNNPALEGVCAVGPIPKGRYSIAPPRTSARTSPNVTDLSPINHTAPGRSAFQIHGDNARGDASSRCIILPRGVREQIWASGLKVIEVVG